VAVLPSGGAAFFMTNEEQADAFSNDLTRLVNRYLVEFDISYPTMVGVIHMHAAALALEGVLENKDEEEAD